MKSPLVTPPLYDSKILTLSPEITAKSIVNRTIFRVLCCGKFMQQIYVQASPPQHGQPFPLSKIILRCPACKHQIQLDVINTDKVRKKLTLTYVLYGIDDHEDDP